MIESNDLPLWHTRTGFSKHCSQDLKSCRQVSIETVSTFSSWQYRSSPMTRSPVTAVAAVDISQLGRTYLLKMLSPEMQDSCTISDEVP
jgi:hypothetical protein